MTQVCRNRVESVLYVVCLGIFFMTGQVSVAQQDSSQGGVKKIILLDESEMIGRIESENSLEIRFKTLSNIDVVIPRNRIKSIEDVFGDVVEGEFRRGDPNRTRLLFAPTARSLKAGQGYFSIYEIFFPMLAFGVTDFATIAAGISLFPFVPNQLVYLAPKVTPLHFGSVDAAGGILYINTTAGDGDGVGIVYESARTDRRMRHSRLVWAGDLPEGNWKMNRFCSSAANSGRAASS